MISNKLFIHSKGLIHLIDQDHIVYCQSDNCYVTLFLADNNQLLIIKSLTQLQKELDSSMFIKVQQSFIVNKNFITHIDKKSRKIHLDFNVDVPFTLSIKTLMEHISFAKLI
jgi:DNA-binding LytR/AlgR family response regulator